jgi:peroxin-11B
MAGSHTRLGSVHTTQQCHSPEANRPSRLTRLNRLAFKCWLTGISLSLISTGSSLVKLRADGRRFALANSVARREYQEKSPEDRVREEEERREKGRALLA